METDRQQVVTRLSSDAPKIWQQYWTEPDVFASVLLVLLLDRYGTESLEWSPETLRMQIQEDFHVVIPDTNFDKLMAAITVVTTDLFYTNVASFIQICNILAGDDFNPTVFDPADSMEMAWGITEAMLLDPPETPQPFSEEIRGYVGMILEDEGFVNTPAILQLGQAIDMPGNIGHEFTDDPEMFQAIYESQTAKVDEVESITQEQLQLLMSQLMGLPLKHGSAKGLLQRVQKTNTT